MTRGQSTQVFNQATDNSKTDQANAQTALGNVNSGLSDYENQVKQFAANDPYKTGGEFQTDQKTIAEDRASANSNALRDQLNLTATRSGQNTAGYAPALASAQRQSTMDAADTEAKADTDRLTKETAFQAGVVDMSKFPVQTNQGVFGTSLAGANQSLSTAGSAAANNKSFGDVFGNAFAQQFGSTLGSEAGGGGGGNA